MPPRADATIPWRRKHDGDNPPVLPQPAARVYPTTLDDLISIVQDAEKDPDPMKRPEVHPSGSHWALSHAAVTSGQAVETHAPENPPEHLNAVLYDVIPPCITVEARAFFRKQAPKPFDPTALMNDSLIYLFHVESGIRIYELYSRIDLGDLIEPRSLASDLAKSGLHYDGPWAMSTLGGAGGQTVMGAISTGTHGGDVHHRPIDDAVQAIHLVGAGGRHHWIERPLPDGSPLVDDDKLRAVYDHIEIHHDETMLQAAVVAAGRMGIVYSVVLRVVRQYALKESRSKDNWSSVKSWVTTISPVTFPNRFLQVVINPNGQPDHPHENTCYVTKRDLVPLIQAYDPPTLPVHGAPKGRPERSGPLAGASAPLGSGPLFTAMCKSNDWVSAAIDYEINKTENVRIAALATAAVLDLVIVNPLTPPGVRDAAFQAQQDALLVAATAKSFVAILWHILDDILPPVSGRFGDEIAAVANWCADNDHFEILRRVADWAFDNDQKDPTPTAISYAVMDLHNYLDVSCSAPGDSLEVFLPASSPNVVTFVNRMIQRVSDLANGALDDGHPRAFGGYCSLRWMGPSFSLLGMQQWVPTVSFEIAGLGKILGTEPFLRTVEADAVALGATVHWGQRNNQPMKVIEAGGSPAPGGPLFFWRKALSDLTENGRYPTFSTEFTRFKGLEVVQPILADFSVSLTNGCEGEPTQLDWTAIRNPPESRVTLEIRPSGSTSHVPPAFVTASLDDSTVLPIPAGIWDFTLIVSRELNGRTLRDQRAIEVRGFANGDVWTFEPSTMCITVDGASRWGVEINLWSQYISNKLRVQELYSTCSASVTWRVRTPGLPDIAFGPLKPRHTFPAPPLFNTDWTFFLDTTGCTGTPPDFHAEFKLVCGP